jgi:chemotaxis protein methyltransferase CheR
LLPVARRAGLATIDDLIASVRSNQMSLLADEVVEAMTTNETFFFRDKVPFEQFKTVIMPALIAARARQRRIRIWCAAASTGQEPYSLAMCLKEMAGQLQGWQIEILGTDLSPSVLEKAKSGIYSQFEVQRGLPIQLLVKYFNRHGEMWQIAPELRAMIQYRSFNLLNDLTSLGRFDVVFCRNVLIYFDQETKAAVLERLHAVIERDGYFVLGAAETVVGLSESFKSASDHRGLYTLQGARPPAAFPRLVSGGRLATLSNRLS